MKLENNMLNIGEQKIEPSQTREEKNESIFVLSDVRKELVSYSEEKEIQSLESRMNRGLDPVGMLAIKEIRTAIEKLCEKQGVPIEQVEEVAIDIHRNGPWGYATRFKEGENQDTASMWLMLLDANDKGAGREMDLTNEEFLNGLERVKGNLEGSLKMSNPLITARENILERSKERFRMQDDVPISERNDGFVYMAANGFEAGVVQDADGLLFVGSKKEIPDETLTSWGLRVELKDDEMGRRDVPFFVNNKGESLIKKIYPGFLIVLSRNFKLAQQIVRAVNHDDYVIEDESLGHKVYSPTSLGVTKENADFIKKSKRIKKPELSEEDDQRERFYKSLHYLKSNQTFRDLARNVIKTKYEKKEKNKEAGKKYPSKIVTKEQIERSAEKAEGQIERKIEELKYLMDVFRKELPNLPRKANKIIDMAGGAGDLALATTTEMWANGRNVDEMRVVDPIEELEEYNRFIIDELPNSEEYKRINNYQLGTLQEANISPDSIVVAKHPCGDLADDIIERWVNSESPMLMIMTCCQEKAAERPARYDISQEDWEKWCKASVKTNRKDNPIELKEGTDAMLKLDTARVEYLRRHGFDARLETATQFPKGDVIVVRRK